MNKFNKLKDSYVDNDDANSIRIPKLIKNCPGSAAVHDVQLSQVLAGSFKLISNPEIVLR